MERPPRHPSTAFSLGNGPLPFNHPLLFVIPSVGWALGPPKVMKNFTGNYFLWSRFHFLVIPTGAKRSGGTCGSADPSLRCFSTGRSRPVPACRGGISSAPRSLPDSKGNPIANSNRASPTSHCFVSGHNLFTRSVGWAFGPPKVMKNLFGCAKFPFRKHFPCALFLDDDSLQSIAWA